MSPFGLVRSAGPPELLGTPLFRDQFASGDKSHTENGVAWLGTGGNATIVSDPGNISGFALRMRYQAFSTQNTEQRFYLGPAGTAGDYKELWAKYRVFWPLNYRAQTGLSGNQGVNNKFFRVWHGNTADGVNGYSSYIVKGGSSTIATATGAAALRPERGADHYGVGDAGEPQTSNLVSLADCGTEVEYIQRIKLDTIGTPGEDFGPSATGNGALEFWKNEVLFASHTGLNWRSSDGTGEYFEYGYVFGYSNSHHAEVTDVLLREFTLATTDIWGVS